MSYLLRLVYAFLWSTLLTENEVMKKMIISIVIIFNSLNFMEPSYCDIIYLKNGRKIEGVVIEKTEDKIRIAVSGGTVAFKMKGVEKIEKTVSDVSAKDTPKEITSSCEEPAIRDVVYQMADEDIRRSISGIRVLSITCNETSLNGYDKCFQANINYQSRYKQNKVIKHLRLFYKYDPLNKRWIRPKKADILKLTGSGNPPAAAKTANESCQEQQGKKWKKEYRVRGSTRRYRRLIGVDQKKHEDWDN